MKASTARELSRIEREQDAFERQLDELMKEHEGQFVIFKDEHPAGFYASYEEAYTAALAQFGVDQAVLVSEVKRREPQTTSPAWEAGVMFR